MKVYALGGLLALLPCVQALTTELNGGRVDAAEQRLWESFVEYALDYQKEYRYWANDHSTVQRKYEAFRVNVDRIQQHNEKYESGEYSFALGLNGTSSKQRGEERRNRHSDLYACISNSAGRPDGCRVQADAGLQAQRKG